jgi:2,3-bisphosphoglycerate-independent phosphoglycerate mutase
MKALPLYYVTFTNYDSTYKNVKVVFNKQNLNNTLGEVISRAGLSQVRIAETEKYPHVTFFFSGGREEPFTGERRIMINSPKVATYDLQPEMSANEVTEAIVKDIHENKADFICLNFANPDMVGHTGVFNAIVKAVETIDQCASRVSEAALAEGYAVLITADHGNADFAVNPDGSPNTAHSTNLVPLYLLGSDRELKDGILADLAPTIIELLKLEKPVEMDGTSLLA